jgi:DNA-directed RNA polymerase subunit RPC12/RpoP
MPMDPMDYFFMEEFIFPEQGGVTGTRPVSCPHCGTEFELEVDVGNAEDAYQCAECRGEFVVDWEEGTVKPESNDT